MKSDRSILFVCTCALEVIHPAAAGIAELLDPRNTVVFCAKVENAME